MIKSKVAEPHPDIINALREHSEYFATSGNDYHVSHLEITRNIIDSLGDREPVSIPGLSMLFVADGETEMELNTGVYSISAGNLLLTDSRTLQKIRSIHSAKADIFLLWLTTDFIRNLNLDINVLQKAHIRTSTDPVIINVAEEKDILTGYLTMLKENALTNNPNSIYTKNISRSLIAALIYQLMQIADRNYVTDVSNRMTTGSGSTNGIRKMNYVKAFMELIHEHYATERSLGFYADKLCISPKYLSTVIKECTNRSAAEWIDEYVMIEAKNMLRFSGMNIQQVAYALNFRNQSAFGKYFKHLAGMSPSQFQKS